MTGEVTLQGRVLPIGGLKQKILAAHAAGLTTVILPERNRGDLDDVPADVREAMSFHPVVSIDEVLDLALGACAEYGGCVTAAFRRYEEGGGRPGRAPPPTASPRGDRSPAMPGLNRRIAAALPALPRPALHRPGPDRVRAILGMVSPFLLRDILDVAIPEDRDELLVRARSAG